MRCFSFCLIASVQGCFPDRKAEKIKSDMRQKLSNAVKSVRRSEANTSADMSSAGNTNNKSANTSSSATDTVTTGATDVGDD